jgi:succinate dehydrogenase/fumarate reductase flavoprotein subunit
MTRQTQSSATTSDCAQISRRSFVRDAAVGAAGIGAAISCAPAPSHARASENGKVTYADTISWDGEYDVVIVGFGGSGAVAATSAAREGASVLLVDKAPWGEVGGNTRYSKQYFMMSDDYQTTYDYYTKIANHFDYDEEPLETYVQGLVDQIDQFEEFYGFTPFINEKETLEYPEISSTSGCHWCLVGEGENSGAQLWKTVRKPVVTTYSDRIDVWYSSPAKRLIQDPETRTVVGVVIDKNGETVNVHARNGVVLSCGGYENSQPMLQAFLGYTNAHCFGSLYNTGDGIALASECGADIRNLCNYSGYGNLGGMCWVQPEDRHAKMLLDNNLSVGSCLVAGGNGQRYVNENAATFGHGIREDRHGRFEHCGEWNYHRYTHDNYYIFDQAQYDELESEGSLTDDATRYMVSASGIEELCDQCEGLDAEVLEDTIRKYNLCVDLGEDLTCKRPIESMRKIDTSTTLYAIPLQVAIENTEGGARRNGNYELVDRDYNAIPHLYGTGEFGGIVPSYVQGNGNLAECLISGRIAGKNAAAEKDPLPAIEGAVAAESDIRYTIDADYEREGQKTFEPESDDEYIGQSELGMGDIMTLKVTVDDGKINDISFLDIYETIGVCDKALVQVPEEIIEKQSTEVDTVAGATITSKAIIDAVNDALSKANA